MEQADLPPADQRSGAEKAPAGADAPGHFGLSAEQLAEFAFVVAGAATGPLMRDNPGYVFPAEAVGAMVDLVVKERFGFDVAQLPGYRGLLLYGEPPTPASGVIDGFLEDWNPADEDAAAVLIELLDKSGYEIVAKRVMHIHEGLEQARQTQPESDRG